MKRALVLLLGLSITLLPGMAIGGLDNKPDSFGVYFDTAGNTNSVNVGAFVPTNVYLLLMNPTTATNGFECTVTPTGAPHFMLSTTLGGTGALDVDSSTNGFAVGAASNYPVANNAIVLVTWSVMLQAAAPLEFRISQASVPSMAGGLPVVSGDGTLRLCQVASGDVNLPVAMINGSVPVIADHVVDIRATSGSLQDTHIRASTAFTATDGFDGALDTPRPAPPPGNYLSASFEHADWPMGPRFSTDIRSQFDPIEEYKSWPLVIETDVNGDVALSFSPSFGQNAGILFYLRDLQTGHYFNLFPAQSYVFTNDGLPNSYRFEVLVGAAPILPVLDPSQREIPSGWSLVGAPLLPASGTTIGGLLLGPAPGFAFAFDYVAGSGYRNLSASAPAVQGTGYWLATDTGFTWTVDGSRDIDGVTVGLTNGWNLIGNPNWFSGPIEGMRVLHWGNSYDWTTAAQMGLVSADVQTYDPATGSYVDTFSLVPWHGYWINALQGDLALQFYWGNFAQLPKRLTEAAAKDDGAWLTDLRITDAAGQCRSITIGRRADASAAFDPLYDRLLPPQPPAGGPRLMIHRPEWELAAGSAASRDVINLDDEIASWNIAFTTPNQGSALLSWDPADWPDGVDFQIYLPVENRVAVRSMRAKTEFALNAGALATRIMVRSPDLTSGVDAAPGPQYTLSISPNPFNPQTTVAFDLPVTCRAEVRIFSLRGELVAILGGESYEAGRHVETWRGIDRHGRDVPSGSYFARLYVEGQVRGAVSRMSLVR